MPCVKPDGTLEPLAQAILRALRHPKSVEEIVAELRIPTFRVRSTARDLIEAELVEEIDGRLTPTEAGMARLS
jgi:predicted transcriptional regulator